MRAVLATLTFCGTLASTNALAQAGTMVYRLGRDTVAIEQFTRTRTQLSGEMVTRSGAAVVRTLYDITLGADGRPSAAVVRRRAGDGSPLPNTPSEYRFTLGPDSVKRTLVWADSTPSRAFAAPRAFPAMPVFVYATVELLGQLRRAGIGTDSIPALGITGNPGFIGLESAGGDTLRLRGAPYAMRLRFDADGRVLLVDGSYTTNKSMGTRSTERVDLTTIARAMAPTGTLSPRMTAQLTIAQGPIMINYGSPAVRGRTVWGGMLVPYDSVWRTGANEATHLATSKAIQLGEVTLEPGLYTLWTKHTGDGTFLIVNRQVGQWGTQYDPAQDIGRVRMTLTPAPSPVENLTITLRGTGPNRGAIEIAWGDSVASAPFTLVLRR
jgi:hypothetical protein